MCGLIYVHRHDKKSAYAMLCKRYDVQFSRGMSGFGAVLIDGAEAKHILRAEEEKTILTGLEKYREPIILFHHRQPTSTPNVVESTHPIKVSHESLQHDYLVAHNGIIWNCDELKKHHETLGFRYVTEMLEQLVTAKKSYNLKAYFNDSESMAIELARTIEANGDKLKAEGQNAFLALQLKKGTKDLIALYYGRNDGNPLKVLQHKDFFTLTSEGDGKQITPNVLYRYDYATGETTERTLDIGDYEIPKVVYNKTTGYGYEYPDEDGYEWDTMGVPRKPQGTRTRVRPDELIDIDSYLEALLDEETYLREQIAHAQMRNDSTTEAELAVELTALHKQISKAENNYMAQY